MSVKLWHFTPALMLTACGGETETVSPQLEQPVDSTARIVNTTPGEPGVSLGMALKRDGTFQLSGWDSVSGRSFLDWDKVRDNRLMPNEFEEGWTAAGLTGSGATFDRLDADKDGALTQEEFQTKAVWESLDQNGDRNLTREELGSLAG